MSRSRALPRCLRWSDLVNQTTLRQRFPSSSVLMADGSMARPFASMAALSKTNIRQSPSTLEINIMKSIILITGASSGFGALAARALARAGHTVYASMRGTTGRNAIQVKEVQKFASENNVDLRAVELDVASQESSDTAMQTIIAECGRLDVVIHNAGHMVFGPAEAFTPDQLAELYDINVLSTQRVNRSALPQLRKQGRGLVVWVSSTSTRGGTPPYLAPYFAAKAAMDALAVSYAGELARWGLETCSNPHYRGQA